MHNRESEALAKKGGMDSGKPKHKLQDRGCTGDKARPGNQDIPSHLVLPPSPQGSGKQWKNKHPSCDSGQLLALFSTPFVSRTF